MSPWPMVHLSSSSVLRVLVRQDRCHLSSFLLFTQSFISPRACMLMGHTMVFGLRWWASRGKSNGVLSWWIWDGGTGFFSHLMCNHTPMMIVNVHDYD
jgi:hypothetical protein